jgi:RNA polymerase sigma factor (sigma-70 family)
MSATSDPQTRGVREGVVSAVSTDWAGLVERIRTGDAAGLEELYRKFSRGIRFYLCRQLGPQELDDKVHDTFLIVVQAIQRGEVREPERLMGFIRTVVKRQVAAHIDSAVQKRRDFQALEPGEAVSDKCETPEEGVISRQRVEIMKSVLLCLSKRDREILTRFYLKEQAQEQICAEMDLTETQFRLLKSRAKARFGELGRRELTRRPLQRLSLRKAAGQSH